MEDVRSGRWCVPDIPGATDALVPGEVHLEQLVPLLVERFGEAWWRRGGIAVRFVSTTISGEPVRAYVEGNGEGRCRVWMNAEGESLILRGTAAVGDPGTDLLELPDRAGAALQGRLLPGVRPGQESSLFPVGITAETVDARLAALTEPMACYREAAPFGERVVPPATLVAAMQAVEGDLVPDEQPAQRLLGGVALRYLDGPVLCERDYRLQGRVLAVGEVGQDEVLWYQADLSDEAGQPVASLLRMEHFGSIGRSHLP